MTAPGAARVTPAFWSGRRVFVTGHTGFKGSWLTAWLLRMGAEVTGYALPPPTGPSLYRALRLADEHRGVTGDVRDAASLDASLRDARPEVVFHLAAQALVRRSYAEPTETFGTNVMGTVHLLDAVRAVGSVGAVVAVTTDKVYENREWVWPYREHDALGGHDPYSSSKAMAELATASYRRSFFPPSDLARHGTAIATARAGNVIGGGDWAEDRLVPDLVRGFERDRPVVIRHPDAVRPWQHVLEPLSGYLVLAERLQAGDADACDAWNFGPDDGDALPVGDLADRLASRWGEGARWLHEPGVGPHEAHVLRLDIAKARHVLRWLPRWTIATAVDRTADWYCGFTREPSAARALTDADLDAYGA